MTFSASDGNGAGRLLIQADPDRPARRLRRGGSRGGESAADRSRRVVVLLREVDRPARVRVAVLRPGEREHGPGRDERDPNDDERDRVRSGSAIAGPIGR